MSDNIDAQMAMWPTFNTVRHDTIGGLFESMFPGMEAGDEICFGAVDSDGNESDLSLDEALTGIRAGGIYGFVDSENLAIHIWMDSKLISFENLVFFLGHEIGHTITEPDLPHKNEIDEENRADGYAFAAKEAYRLASEIAMPKAQTVNATAIPYRSSSGKVVGYDKHGRKTMCLKPGLEADSNWLKLDCRKVRGEWIEATSCES